MSCAGAGAAPRNPPDYARFSCHRLLGAFASWNNKQRQDYAYEHFESITERAIALGPNLSVRFLFENSLFFTKNYWPGQYPEAAWRR